MDKERKRELKRMARIAIEEESRSLREVLQRTNKAPFASNEYVRNEISIRVEESRMRLKPRRLTMKEITENYVVKEQAFPSGLDYPLQHTAFWFCPQCDVAVPSRPRRRMSCSCGNVSTGFPLWKIILARVAFFRREDFEYVRNNWVGWSELKGGDQAVPVFIYPRR